jgi:excisionase family DNA binding protein
MSIVSSNSEVNTQQAADILRVSVPQVIKLLEDGVIPHKRNGNGRVILLEDLVEYNNKVKAKRNSSPTIRTAFPDVYKNSHPDQTT